MPPRGHGRRKIGKTSSTAGKASAKKSIKSSSPSITLQEILDNLGIQFDKDIGLLNGESTRIIPSISTLESLRKSLVKLNDQLEIVSNHDELTIEQVTRQLKVNNGEVQEDEDIEMDDSDVFTAEATPIPKDSESKDLKKDEEDDVKMEDISSSPNKDEVDTKDEDNEKKVKKEDEDDEDEDEDEDKPLADTTPPPSAAETITKDEDVLVDIPKDDLKSSPSKRKLSHQEEIENDPSVRNPKSEFVTSQTLPAAAIALGLFSDKDGGLEESGDEYLKKKYAVSSYPKNDLKDLLPGPIPDIDFSKSKPSNQVQFATFQSFIENFYRNFTEDDLKFLKNKYIMTDALTNDSNYDPNLTPYLIPNLGQLYSLVWNEEENSSNYSPPPSRVTHDSILPKKSSTDLNDDVLETEDVSCGPLVSRLLSAILKDDKGNENGSIDNNITNSNNTTTTTTTNNNNNNEKNDDDITITASNTINNEPRTSTSALPEQQGWKVSSVNADYNSLEDRLKRELKYIGIFMNLNSQNGSSNNNENNNNNNNKDDDEDQEPDWMNPQDDEVSTELRQLQNELKTVSRRNNKRKKELLPIIENQLAWQEYLSILDDLDKQVDSAYLKRIRVPKHKKKKTASGSSSNTHGSSVPPSVQIQQQAQQAHQAAANSAIKSLLEKRIRWINRIGPLFEKPDGGNMKRIPKESVFSKGDLDEEEEEDYEDGEDLVLQQQQ
ncbi:Chromatin-remodeling complexes subunit NGG1 [Wickerhamomyces ciferrii]|uniref:Chromatin-remodeling complexes subunit NGG1 n=1 Tax=Wickerhamomyces ciferrii (strain ATCC 14091 / BCRC 22168 / CBS 111 / JCM 3599 / NBRC 0793 / NRRL Y-1031 F-60-10) TaxID=1206466 RepID=K0KQC7_WICCF|nr:Chromatin-remodeling complexes subunit NGG1 [Wickerhamomyces ciferrii]CCH43433.1 Chromatin-remodeling complexes subunit NGG1 [Wickerhamomyces ciferrii]